MRPRLSLLCLTLIAALIAPNEFHAADTKAVQEGLAQKREEARSIERRMMALSESERIQLLKSLAPTGKMRPPPPHSMEFLHAIQFHGHLLGWAIDWNGVLHKTTSGGLHWHEIRLSEQPWLLKQINPQEGVFRSLHFADESYGLIVGPAGILETMDGGANWKGVSRPTRTSQPNAVFCTVSRTCWLGADNLMFLKREIESNWRHQTAPNNGVIAAIQFYDDKLGWAVTLKGEIIGTQDGGNRWGLLYFDGKRKFNALHFVDGKVGWVVGSDASILRTGDGGSTWQQQKIRLPDNFPVGEVRLNAVKFVDGQKGWVAGLHGMIFATDDAGQSWRLRRFEGLTSWWLTVYALTITPGPTIWAAGNSGNIFVSTDSGEYWFPVHGAAVEAFADLKRKLDAR